MRIAILTPLFPPDIGEPAPYTKLLAEKLSKHHPVTVFLYGHLPEQAGTATLVTTDKRLWLLLRLAIYTLKLLLQQHRYDLLIVNNGPSTELPSLSLAVLRRKSTILVLSDPLAQAQASAGSYKLLHEFFKKRVSKTINVTLENSRTKPEMLPFTAFEPSVVTEHETWWKGHLEELVPYEK